MNATPLIDYLLQFGTLNSRQIELIGSLVTHKQVPAGDYFLKAGQTSREVGFITEGICRVCYYDQEGNEITRYFLDEGHFVVDIQGFNLGIPSGEYIQAVTDGELLILSKAATEELSKTLLIWDELISKITAKAMAEKVTRVSWMMPMDATARYRYFLEHFPNLANRVPLQFIASYIGVTKSSLSRLRRELNSRD
ncbi:MAG TPA: Crp/Fnr family transcriptional regulator [Cytophagales bacterium]|nr:Crp/Fnr family transcriptional regulator [Cytophagales bacterium]HAP59938.1 Crp/Fnr family transcriptional regulator [Cytophagales bacterium]